MTMRHFHSVVAVIFLVLGIGHFIRVMNGVPASVGAWEVPLWISWVVVVVALYLSYTAMKLRH